MPARKPTFYQADIKRIIGAAQSAGLRSYRIDIHPNGLLSLVVGDLTAPRGNSWDDLSWPEPLERRVFAPPPKRLRG